MKAYVLEALNKLNYKEVNIPKLKKGWVLVRVKAVGICGSDIPRIFYKGAYHYPMIPGHEFSGIVEKVGDDCDKKWIGKRVGIFPLIPCKTCEFCRKAKYEICENYDYIGSRRDGAFAEYVEVPEWNLIELKDDASFVDNAMLEPVAVALHSIKSAGIKEGENVTVVGTGMIGISTALWAVKLGAGKVQVVGRNDFKEKIVNQYKDLIYINYKKYPDFPLSDIVIEAVGTNESIELAIRAAKSGGRIVLMGNPAGNMELSKNVYWKILRRQLRIIGTWNSSYECDTICDWTEARDAIYNKEIDVSKLVTHTYLQHELVKGLQVMKNHEEMYCKIMTIWNQYHDSQS